MDNQQFEKVRKELLVQLTKEKMKRARMMCEPQIQKFERLSPSERDHTIPNKMAIVPQQSSTGVFWVVYFEDLHLATSARLEMAICKAAIVVNDTITVKLNQMEG
ncbi:hypothetical protein SAMN04487895_12855 [Paenibacillus sophorae]|uniref:Uncharacterized protein n=1 Tax=Paenibacillus sophorae TaxID=1333845 RepID=A0A1H8VXF4_9BACL|nr:hypothetical protein [Paenibacillus sophorae]QWU15612.1 hypothetical protein KP014_27880 [Paenibacillus sophorae]SEP19953.1 hypothetical protein SAMN04487895_12855 [Paenibacillus sophorae]